MRRWFQSQPIHRKLVITSMAKTTVVLFAAMVTLLALDAWRFKINATAAANALSATMADGIRVNLTQQDAAGVAETLTTADLQPSVQRVCAYAADGALFSQYLRTPTVTCAPNWSGSVDWATLGANSPVTYNGAIVGHVYVENSWVTMRARFLTAGASSLGVLILAALVMLVVSHRLHRRISDPITQLAAAARRMGEREDFEIPEIAASKDEVGDLVIAFRSMRERIRAAQQGLTESNEALRREIDERRQVEAEREALLTREREANRIKDEFLATVSHELRTPLNAIVGWARILVTGTPDRDTIAKASASLHRNALAQARVIDDLIDISRVATGKLKVVAEPVDLRGVVESGVEIVRPSAARAGVSLTVDMPPTACVMMGDRGRLLQIVSNLLSNAVKFAPRGHVRVALEAGSNLTLSVTDTGIGIAPEFLALVFDRFRQADASMTREHGGLGIGLAIAKELVELHGGTIRAESAGRGRGSTFTAVFPCARTAVAADTVDGSVPSLAGLSVLVVDDNQDALDVLGFALRGAGADVRVAASGMDALTQWEDQPSDVLMCDLSMPRMSGFELLDRIRSIDRASGRVTPAIAVTAHATEEEVARTAKAGFQMHLAKPLDVNRLIRAVSVLRTL